MPRLTDSFARSAVIPPGKREAWYWDDTLSGFGHRVRAGGSRTWVARHARPGTTDRRHRLGRVDVLRAAAAHRRPS